MRVPKFALFSNLLLTSVALAVLSSQQEARIAHNQEDHHSQPIKSVVSSVRASTPYGNPNWAGAVVFEDSNGHLTSMTGTFTIPNIICSSSRDCGAKFYVGFNSYRASGSNSNPCPTAIQAGIRAGIFNNNPSYHAWMEYSMPVSNLVNSYNIPSTPPISPGDVIVVSITQLDNGTVVTIINDQTTGWAIPQSVNDTNICGQDVEWMVGPYNAIGLNGLYSIPVAKFDTVKFTYAVGTDIKNEDHNPLNATLIGDIFTTDPEWARLTLTTAGKDSLDVKYY